MSTILLIDDEQDHATMIKILLEFAKYTVVHADKIETAMALTEGKPVDLIIYAFFRVKGDMLKVEQLSTHNTLTPIPYLILTFKSAAELQTEDYSIPEKWVFQYPLAIQPFLQRVREILEDANLA